MIIHALCRRPNLVAKVFCRKFFHGIKPDRLLKSFARAAAQDRDNGGATIAREGRAFQRLLPYCIRCYCWLRYGEGEGIESVNRDGVLGPYQVEALGFYYIGFCKVGGAMRRVV